MSYASVMVYVEADAAPEQRVRLAAVLADRFGAQLLGLSALAIPPPPPLGIGQPMVAPAVPFVFARAVADGMVISAAAEVDIKLMEGMLADKADWFRRIAGDGRRQPEWRSALDFPVELLVREARSADLVVIGQRHGPGTAYRSLDPGEAILKMGRPTLVVPEGANAPRAEHVVIGWKDTREARGAVRDALPFLQRATRVTIVEACGPDDEKTALVRLGDVARYLSLHRIEGGPMVVLEQKGSGAEQLIRVAQEERADLLVTGAYGHSRLGEWIFGGMTRELLAKSPICCLMSH
jgi:nucleotide-binding universal stress UspA family protein